MAKKATKVATKKVAAKKTSAKKAGAKKAPIKKVAAKKAVAPKPAPAKKKSVKKVALKKEAPKKVAVKKVATPKKAAAPKVVQTTITARVDVGFGNTLYIRGEGGGLSWEKGIILENVSPYEWTYKTSKAKSDIEFKLLINDEVWSEGDNIVVKAGGTSISSPAFAW